MEKIIWTARSVALISLFSTFFFLSCKKEPLTPLDTELDFKLRVLNNKRQEVDIFKEGENFWLSFLIINKSSKTWFLDPESIDKNDKFLRVFNEAGTNMGKPYNGFFTCLLLPKLAIKSNDTTKIEIMWHNTPNAFFVGYFCATDTTNKILSKGNYKTSFTNNFKFFRGDDKDYSKELYFEKQFQIQ